MFTTTESAATSSTSVAADSTSSTIRFSDDVDRCDALLVQMRALHTVLFPVQYGSDFFDNLKTERILLVCAFDGHGLLNELRSFVDHTFVHRK